jgi:predicted secreted protein with PEFG-CTERM motif
MLDETAKHSRSILLAIIASTLILGSGMQAVYAQTTLTVETNADDYATGDTIRITGRLQATTINQPILIQVLDPQGNRDRIDQVDAAADGSYSYSFTAGGLMNTDGEYTVLVSYRTTEEETTFQFDATGSGDGWTRINVNIGGTNHEIEYMITGGRLTRITGDVATLTFTATVVANSDGKLSLRFDEDIFDADDTFAVLADDQFVDELPAGPGATNTLEIDFDAGTDTIEIIGDRMIPEFGAIAAIILAVAIVGIILATARYSKLGSFVRKDW